MKLSILIFILLLVLTSGCRNEKLSEAELDELAESWSLTNQELKKLGIEITGERQIYVEAAGAFNGGQGFFMITYGEDESVLMYSIYPHLTEEEARNHYEENVASFKEAAFEIIEEAPDIKSPYVAVRGGAGEGFALWHNYKTNVILIMGFAGFAQNHEYNDIALLNNEIRNKIDQNLDSEI